MTIKLYSWPRSSGCVEKMKSFVVSASPRWEIYRLVEAIGGKEAG